MPHPIRPGRHLPVTLTTLGYGEIVALSPVARTLAWMEAVAGQLFMAVLVVRLVGLHVVHSAADDSPRDG